MSADAKALRKARKSIINKCRRMVTKMLITKPADFTQADVEAVQRLERDLCGWIEVLHDQVTKRHEEHNTLK